MSRSMVMLEERNEPSCCHPAPVPHQHILTESPRRNVPSKSPGRIPLSVAAPIGSLRRSGHESIYANCSVLREAELQLYRERERGSPCHSARSAGDHRSSQLSLASSSALSMAEQVDFEKALRELDHCQREVGSLRKSEDNYQQTLDLIGRKVIKLRRTIEKQNNLSSDEKIKMQKEFDSMMLILGTATHYNVDSHGSPLHRHPSQESLGSQRSCRSASSKNSRTDMSAVSGFSTGKNQKKNWTSPSVQFRSSISRFTKGHKKREEASSNSSKPTVPDESPTVQVLKRQLAEQDMTLHDVRLDAVTHANEAMTLREEVHRLQCSLQRAHVENARMREATRQVAIQSRASSRASVRLDEDTLYEIPPSSSRSSASSKYSSGCTMVRVTVNVDLRGRITAAINPDHEISIGFLSVPSEDATWENVDQQLFNLFNEYLSRIDPENSLGLNAQRSVIGYQTGIESRDLWRGSNRPSKKPHEIITVGSRVRIFLRGAEQKEMDSLVLGTLFPSNIVCKLLRELTEHRRVILYGATGLGKSLLARQVATLQALRMGLAQDAVYELSMPEKLKESALAEKQVELDTLLADSATPRVLLLDNLPRARVSLVASAVSAAGVSSSLGPFIICTVNRAYQLPGAERAFKMFLLTNRMDGVKGFMIRFLRRRLAEQEYRSGKASSPEMECIIEFLVKVLSTVNLFIEKANSEDVTIGPRTFCACPLDVEESRSWFITQWNENLVRYMVTVATEGVKVLGRSGSFDDPTDTVCAAWPWLEGAPPSECLRRLSDVVTPASSTASSTCSPYGVPSGISTDSKNGAVSSPFNALDALIRVRHRPSDNTEMVN